MLAGGVATNVELGYRSKDGPPRHIVCNGLLKDGLIDAYGRDVTHEWARAADLARAQDALPQAENRLSPTLFGKQQLFARLPGRTGSMQPRSAFLNDNN